VDFGNLRKMWREGEGNSLRETLRKMERKGWEREAKNLKS
jgi:hypothetical protein